MDDYTWENYLSQVGNAEPDIRLYATTPDKKKLSEAHTIGRVVLNDKMDVSETINTRDIAGSEIVNVSPLGNDNEETTVNNDTEDGIHDQQLQLADSNEKVDSKTSGDVASADNINEVNTCDTAESEIVNVSPLGNDNEEATVDNDKEDGIHDQQLQLADSNEKVDSKTSGDVAAVDNINEVNTCDTAESEIVNVSPLGNDNEEATVDNDKEDGIHDQQLQLADSNEKVDSKTSGDVAAVDNINEVNTRDIAGSEIVNVSPLGNDNEETTVDNDKEDGIHDQQLQLADSNEKVDSKTSGDVAAVDNINEVNTRDIAGSEIVNVSPLGNDNEEATVDNDKEDGIHDQQLQLADSNEKVDSKTSGDVEGTKDSVHQDCVPLVDMTLEESETTKSSNLVKKVLNSNDAVFETVNGVSVVCFNSVSKRKVKCALETVYLNLRVEDKWSRAMGDSFVVENKLHSILGFTSGEEVLGHFVVSQPSSDEYIVDILTVEEMTALLADVSPCEIKTIEAIDERIYERSLSSK